VGRYLALPILLIAAVLQSTIVPEIRIGNGGPDLVLMLVLSWTLLADIEEGVVWAIVGGVIQDLINGVPLGTSALALVLLAFAVNLSIRTIASNNLIIPLPVAAVGTILYHLMLFVLLAILGRRISMGYMLASVTLPTLVYNAALMLPIFRLAGWVYRASRPRRVTL
jgi:rod shape-determining protein MreD